MPDLSEIIHFFEERNNEVRRAELEAFGVSNIDDRVLRGDFIKCGAPGYHDYYGRFHHRGFYSLSAAFYQKFNIRLLQAGCRLDKQLVTPAPGASIEFIKRELEVYLKRRIERDHMLLQSITYRDAPGGGFYYELNFYPGRCSLDERRVHVVMDANRPPDTLKKLARVAEGHGSWELGRHFRNLASHPPADANTALQQLISAVERNHGTVGPLLHLSVGNHTMEPTKFAFRTRTRDAGVLYEDRTRTYGFSEELFATPGGPNRERLLSAFQKLGLKSAGSIASITLKRILPGMAIYAAADHVLHADDAVAAAAEEAHIFAGGGAGAAAGAAAAVALGPIGVFAGAVLGSLAGGEVGRLAHRAVRAVPGAAAPVPIAHPHLYSIINIPLPSPDRIPVFCDSDTEDEVCRKIDAYFDDTIRNYSAQTKQLLRDMYYRNTNVIWDLRLQDGSQANWSLEPNGLIFKMFIDSRLRECPIQVRLNKIHEIAVHIGQAHQRIEQIGYDAFMDELPTFRKFTEQSAAPVEKILYDVLPSAVIERDLSHAGIGFFSLTGIDGSISFVPTAEFLRNTFYPRQHMSFHQYIRLEHCPDDGLTESNHRLFLENSQISQVMNLIAARDLRLAFESLNPVHLGDTPMPRQTTEHCLSNKQRDFLKYFMHYLETKRFFNGAVNEQTAAAKARAERSSEGFCNIEFMEAYIRNGGHADFDCRDPIHLKGILPHIVAMNDDRYLQHLSAEDYGRVMHIRRNMAPAPNPADDSELNWFERGVANMRHFLARIGHREPSPINEAVVEACPEYWQRENPERMAEFYLSPNVTEEAKRRMRAHEARGNEQREVIRMFARVDEHLDEHDARFDGLRAQVDRLNREVVGEAARNQACQGLLLEFTRNQMLQGLEGDAEAQAILRRFREEQARLGIQPGSREDLALTTRFQRDIGVRRASQEADRRAEADFKTWQQIAQDIAGAAGLMARWSGNRTIAKIGKAVAIGAKLGEGFHKFNLASVDFAKSLVEAAANPALASELSTAATGNVVGGIFALMSALDMLMPKEDGLGEAIAGIQEQLNVIQDMIQGMWTEMRESFQLTWEILERMEDNNAKRFVIAKEYLEKIIQDNIAIRHDQAVNFASLRARLTLIHRELGDGIRDGMDAGYRQVLREISEGDEAYLRAHYPFVVSRITDWLLVTAMNAAKTGYIEADRPGGRFKPDGIALEAMRTAAHPEKRLGLLAAIAHSIVPGIAPTPASIVSDDAWPRVSEAYDGLIRYHGITDEGSRARMVGEARTLQEKATEVRSFLAAIKSPEDGRQLFNKLLNTYVNSLRKAKERVEEVLEMERKRINREKLGHLHMTREEVGLIEGRVLLKLDETLEETGERLEATLDDWENPAKIQDWKFSLTREAIDPLWGVRGRFVPGLYGPNFHLGEREAITTLGAERITALEQCARGEIRPAGISEADHIRLVADAQRLFDMDRTTWHLGTNYNLLSISEGRWAFYSELDAGGPRSVYFVCPVRYKAKEISWATIQFSAHAGGSTNLAHMIRADDPAKPLITASPQAITLLAEINTDLDNILEEGRKNAAQILQSDKLLTSTLNGIEISRLCLLAYFKLLGVELTAEQQALLISPEQILTMLTTIEHEATAVSVKSLLSCLNLSKLRLPAIPAPIAVIPVVPPANAGAGREAVPVAPALPANGGAGREPALPAAVPAAGAGRAPVPAAPIADEHATTCEELQRFIWSLVPASIDALPLYRDMSAAETRLGVLVRDLSIMPLRVLPAAEAAREIPGVRVPEIAALDERVEALHEDNAALRARVDVLHEDNVALRAEVGALTAMLRELLAAHRAPGAEDAAVRAPEAAGGGFFARRAAPPPPGAAAGAVAAGY
jgi:hypothetical protein